MVRSSIFLWKIMGPLQKDSKYIKRVLPNKEDFFNIRNSANSTSSAKERLRVGWKLFISLLCFCINLQSVDTYFYSTLQIFLMTYIKHYKMTYILLLLDQVQCLHPCPWEFQQYMVWVTSKCPTEKLVVLELECAAKRMDRELTEELRHMKTIDCKKEKWHNCLEKIFIYLSSWNIT